MKLYQVNPRFIINLDLITYIDTYGDGEWEVHLSNDTSCILSDAEVQDLLEMQ